MNPDRIEWGTGQIQHWNLAFLDEARPLAAQVLELKEDLAQVAYPSRVILDIGWYPEFSEGGAFEVCVVRNDEWDKPLFRTRCSTIAALLDAISEAVALATEFTP